MFSLDPNTLNFLERPKTGILSKMKLWHLFVVFSAILFRESAAARGGGGGRYRDGKICKWALNFGRKHNSILQRNVSPFSQHISDRQVKVTRLAQLPGEKKAKYFRHLLHLRFPNGPCAGADSLNGTCFTEAECSGRGGQNGGACASGFGVCCICERVCYSRKKRKCYETIFFPQFR